MTIDEAWLLFRYSYEPRLRMSQSRLYESLAEELIEDKYDVTIWGSAHAPESDQDSNFELVAEVETHLTVAINKRKLSTGDSSNAALQGSCCVCKVSRSNFSVRPTLTMQLGSFKFVA